MFFLASLAASIGCHQAATTAQQSRRDVPLAIPTGTVDDPGAPSVKPAVQFPVFADAPTWTMYDLYAGGYRHLGLSTGIHGSKTAALVADSMFEQHDVVPDSREQSTDVKLGSLAATVVGVRSVINGTETAERAAIAQHQGLGIITLSVRSEVSADLVDFSVALRSFGGGSPVPKGFLRHRIGDLAFDAPEAFSFRGISHGWGSDETRIDASPTTAPIHQGTLEASTSREVRMSGIRVQVFDGTTREGKPGRAAIAELAEDDWVGCSTDSKKITENEWLAFVGAAVSASLSSSRR